MAVRENLQKEKGQAVFEFIVFMPLLVFLFTIMVKVGNSINLSINQQKVTRRYFYQFIQNSSNAPIMISLQQNLQDSDLTLMGMSSVAWREKDLEGVPNSALAPCIKMGQLFSKATDESCEEPSIEDEKTRFLRVYTAYGICGETYVRESNQYVRYKDVSSGSNLSVLNTGVSCVFR